MRISMTIERGGSPRRRSRSLVLVIVGLLLAGSLVNMHVTAEEGGGKLIGLNQQGSSLIAPDPSMLSSFAGAAVTGNDPRWFGRTPQDLNLSVTDPSLGNAAAGTASGSGAATNQMVPFRSPAPAFSRNMIVSRSLGNYPVSTEPHIAVNPLDPDHIVAGVIDFNLSSIAIYVSFDAGETWDGPRQPRFFREDWYGAGDPVIAFDRDGNVYASMLSIGLREVSIGNISGYLATTTISVSKSEDGGLTWLDGTAAARGEVVSASDAGADGRERGTVSYSFVDKQWMTVGPSPDDPSKDIIYLTFTNFLESFTFIYADELAFEQTVSAQTVIQTVTSADGGVTWSEAVETSPVYQYYGMSSEGEGGAQATGVWTPRNEGDPGSLEVERYVQGSQPVVLSDGTLVVAYWDCLPDGSNTGLQAIQVVTSTDKGQTFSEATTAALTYEMHGPTRTVPLRIDASAFPQLAAGPDDQLYISFAGASADDPTDDADIFFISSLDGSASWSTPIRVNQDDTNHLQFLPSMAVRPDGTIGIMWGDTRDDPYEIRYHVYFTQSVDGGETWGFTIPDQDFTAPDVRVSDFASSSLRVCPRCAPEIGDYWSMAATEDEWYLAWIDNRMGDFGGFDTRLAFARQTPIDPPTLFLNPPSGVAGRTVDLQGFGFQPFAYAQVIVGGIVVKVEMTNEYGEFQTQFSMPLTGEGPISVVAYDESGNAATSSFYVEFGFDTLQTQLDTINQTLEEQGNGNGSGQPDAEATPAS